MILSYVPLEVLSMLRFHFSQGCQQLNHVLIGTGIPGRRYWYRRRRNVKKVWRSSAISQRSMIVAGIVVRCGTIIIVIRVVISAINVRLAWIIIFGRLFSIQLQCVIHSYVKCFVGLRCLFCICKYPICVTKVFHWATQLYHHVVKLVSSISDGRLIRGNASVIAIVVWFPFWRQLK